ncbi:DUF503 domain-containing protein [Desulfosarcina ovata]|uniref:DUF503 domain-containing protein n=2 Tax=Desulfosarcina ovata TaxID=83564 RepID=A0A5K8AHC7_9BACT|nr:DUF503 domain-containing protein [Desulfosarcina ovata]BBO85147.1 hypothetical protein DSCO28_57130 [Desulfosarcina ovata subsp. sediminis]BBO91899.1 hypothetical protein DSCOOX_50790 [Desulfosarcina ovata subsp. ovata]
MVVGVGCMVFRIHECHSLKAKRKVVKAMVARIRNHFNASVAEVADNDIYQRATIGVSMVGNDRRLINAKLDKLFNFVEDLGLAEMIETDLEIISL